MGNEQNAFQTCPCGSGKFFAQCHGAYVPPSSLTMTAPVGEMARTFEASPAVSVVEVAPGVTIGRDAFGQVVTGSVARSHPIVHGGVTIGNPMAMAAPPRTLKLDLASGQSPREGFEGVDVWEGAQHRVDLRKYPWPWADSSVDELHCSHYIEHIPMEYVMHGGREKDALMAFFDECYRILRPDGWITVQWPCHRSDRAFQDPTHRRFIPAAMALYLNRDWRRAQKLDHYAIDCNFGTIGTVPGMNGSGLDVVPITDPIYSTMHAEVAMQKVTQLWNTVHDWLGRFQAKKT